MALTYYDYTYGDTRLERARRMYGAVDHHIQRIVRLRSGRVIHVVRSQTRMGVTYNVNDVTPSCTCPDFVVRGTAQCKHIILVGLVRRSGRRLLRPRPRFVGNRAQSECVRACVASGCEFEARYACEACRKATYCSPECQETHWRASHSSACV